MWAMGGNQQQGVGCGHGDGSNAVC
jgi:hypothetical protein